MSRRDPVPVDDIPVPDTPWGEGGGVRRLAPLLLTIGLVLSAAGWLDFSLFWYPPRFGEADWEFGIISGSLDAMPLGTMGCTLMALAALSRGGPTWALRAMAIVFGLLAVMVAGMAVIYALDLPQALRAMTDPRLAPGLQRTILKGSILLVSYAVAYAASCIILWRAARRASWA